MNADERTPGQQDYGQQTGQTSQQPIDDQQKQPTGQDQQAGSDGFATGQAAYGNSGELDVSDQQFDASRQGASGSNPDESGSGLFSASSEDMGNADSEGMTASGTQPDQDFAPDGQGAQDSLLTSSNRNDVDRESSQQSDQSSTDM